MSKKQVWIDTDLAVGMKQPNSDGYADVDDGYAVLQLIRSKQVNVVGLGAVFGNATLENAYTVGQYISRTFADDSIPVYKGAAAAVDLSNVVTNEAVEALAGALKQQKLVIAAIGPATNVALLLLKYPELKDQIEEVVLVAGRRKPTDYFTIGTRGLQVRDLNFDLDNDAFRVLFKYQVPVTLCPYELSSKAQLTKEDLAYLAEGNAGSRWLADKSQAWWQQWANQGASGFHPFDLLASHYIIMPNDIVAEPLNARLEIHADDTVKDNDRQAFKQYLICDRANGYPIRYCYGVVAGYHQKMLNSLFNKD